MVEFKKDQRDGRFKLMEINPRFWGSLNLAIQSGVDFPYLFYDMALTGDCDVVLDYKVGVKCKNFDWELSHLKSFFIASDFYPQMFKHNFIKSLFSVALSQFTIRDDYLSISDSRPFGYELIYSGRSILRR
jgi:predicted ATP-grasp superfamily ATP-dependent carboligase